MQLIDITQNNWEQVILLTTNKNNRHTLGEEFVASNAYSIVQSVFETGWITKAIEHDGNLIGFAMYGHCEEKDFYELCRFMIDHKYQGKGYGKLALAAIIKEMQKQFGCDEVYLSTEPENVKGKHIYEQFGFVNTGEIWDGEELYCLRLKG